MSAYLGLLGVAAMLACCVGAASVARKSHWLTGSDRGGIRFVATDKGTELQWVRADGATGFSLGCSEEPTMQLSAASGVLRIGRSDAGWGIHGARGSGGAFLCGETGVEWGLPEAGVVMQAALSGASVTVRRERHQVGFSSRLDDMTMSVGENTRFRERPNLALLTVGMADLDAPVPAVALGSIAQSAGADAGTFCMVGKGEVRSAAGDLVGLNIGHEAALDGWRISCGLWRGRAHLLLRHAEPGREPLRFVLEEGRK